MAIPSVMQGLIETEDGKVFELDSPKGAAWVETIGSFRFEPAGHSKPCTVRKEASGYWYGCRKVAGKVRKKYIGKTSEVNTVKLEEIAAALEVPPVPRVNKVAEVAQEVTEGTQVAEKVTQVAEDRFTALELEVANLRKALEALQEALPGKLELGDSAELPKVDNAVAEELQNKLSNLKAENEKLRADYDTFLESSTVVTKKLDQEVQKLRSQLETEKTRGEEIWEELSDTEQALAEVQSENSELKKSCAELRSQLETERSFQKEVETELARLAADREELAQLKKEAKEAATETHREGNAIKVERIRWQRELSDARAELADAKATILNQGNKIRELERGYSLQPNPAEKRLRLEIGELQAQIADLKQKSATASKDLPEAAEILNQLKSKRKKSKTDLADLEIILEILES
jgi:chromosome segregation ATPase